MNEVFIKTCGDHMFFRLFLFKQSLYKIVSEIDEIVVSFRDIKNLATVPDGQICALAV